MTASEVREPVTALFPFAASGVRAARQRLADDLQRSQVSPARIDDARLVLSELMANAIMHARPLPSGCIVASWQVDDRGVTISVTDGGGPTEPQPASASLLATGGRGLAVVQELSVDWGVRGDAHEVTVYATIPA